MEALRDRTVKIDIPYITKLNEEVKIYEKDYNSHKIRGKHIAPHTLEMRPMWACSRGSRAEEHNLTLLQKLKLYNGKTCPGFTEATSRSCARRRTGGMEGSARGTCRTRSPTRW